MAVVKSDLLDERTLLDDTERKRLLLRISALEDLLLAVLTMTHGEPKATKLYHLAIRGMEQANQKTANYINRLQEVI